MIESHDVKEQPFEDLPVAFEELPELDYLLVQLLDWIRTIWVMIEDRTREYNQLRDELNIISMECVNINVGAHSEQD